MNKQAKNTLVVSSHMLQKAATDHATAIRHEENCLTPIRRLVFSYVNILKQAYLLLHNVRFILVARAMISHTCHFLISVESCSGRHTG